MALMRQTDMTQHPGTETCVHCIGLRSTHWQKWNMIFIIAFSLESNHLKLRDLFVTLDGAQTLTLERAFRIFHIYGRHRGVG